MNFLDDIIAHNMSEKINSNIADKDKGFLVFVHHGQMIIESKIHPWTNNHKGVQMQENAIKRLQKQIGGSFEKDVFKRPRLTFDVSSIKSARCNKNKRIFGFDGYIEVETIIKDDDSIIVPLGMIDVFKKEFPTLNFQEENKEWEFIEYDGSYPTFCNGDTVFKCGDVIIKTKIISHRSYSWTVKIPKTLEKVKIPSEIFEWDGAKTECCGGCE